MSNLNGKVIIITGASRGIGAAAAVECARQGAKLSISSRNAADCADVLEKIDGVGGEAFAASCDVSDFNAVEQLVKETIERFGKVDAIVNNAGIVDPVGLIEDTDPQEWARNISVNLVGVYNGIRSALPHFYKQGSGTIINISSGAAHNPLEGWSAYCSGKAGVYMMTRATAHEAGEKGVKVFGFAPGVVDTDMQGIIRASGINRVSQLPRENLSPSHEPAAAIAWLCGEQSDDLAGQELDVRNEDLRKRVGLPAIA
ncbi:SDR family NAD(P)-dependent oxidoreductase [Sneathiella sp.]|jgi:NAD(P)-dependent dehydrogenase (short-subunit alcohol dehydrogenase family)|uniref:SDR family NAD(P)-dependent oxidoreductase n=1 Tax=Sneathiella sp. TaxID=1964365 RepID=UPI0039E39879